MITNGTVLTYQGRWDYNAFGTSVAGMVGDVTNRLTAIGLAVRQEHHAGSVLQGIVGSGYIDVTMTLQVNNGVGYGSLDDIISIIRGIVYQVFGASPEFDTIPYSQAGAGAPTQNTGQPVSNNSPSPTSGTPGYSVTDSIKQWFSSFGSGATWGIVAVGLGFVVAVFLIARKD